MPNTGHYSIGFLSERGIAFLQGIPKIEGDLPGWTYYVLCGLFFISCGLITGYFIWRKGHLQTLDAESEVRDTGNELLKLREDLKMEETELGLDRDAKEAGKESSETFVPSGDQTGTVDHEPRIPGIIPA